MDVLYFLKERTRLIRQVSLFICVLLFSHRIYFCSYLQHPGRT